MLNRNEEAKQKEEFLHLLQETQAELRACHASIDHMLARPLLTANDERALDHRPPDRLDLIERRLRGLEQDIAQLWKRVERLEAERP